MPLFHEFAVAPARCATAKRGKEIANLVAAILLILSGQKIRERELRHSDDMCLGQSPADAMGTAAACFRQVAKPSRARPKMVWR